MAGLRRRVASLLYEALLLVGIAFVAASLFLALMAPAGFAYGRPLLQAWLLCIAGAYFIYCWHRGGQTLPMRTWGLRLATPDGRPLGLNRALLRYVLAVPGALTGVGFAYALVDRDRQFLHDRLAGTRVFASPRARARRSKVQA